MNKEFLEELKNVEGCLGLLDKQIDELREKKKVMMNNFLSKLPYQEGDKVEDETGKKYIIANLYSARVGYGEHIDVTFDVYKVKKSGEPYQNTRRAWALDYFSLKKATD